MHLNLSNQMTMKQEHVMSPNMIKSMEILQLNSMGLLEKVDQELEDNPLLENENSEDGLRMTSLSKRNSILTIPQTTKTTNKNSSSKTTIITKTISSVWSRWRRS